MDQQLQIKVDFRMYKRQLRQRPPLNLFFGHNSRKQGNTQSVAHAALDRLQVGQLKADAEVDPVLAQQILEQTAVNTALLGDDQLTFVQVLQRHTFQLG
ncbi:hypothetical protein D3C75_1201360 [compost metagenome]